jgi:benzoyl-CoA reductase/2-hydroxyglutaryl-CoA dehydratase subunit BcrC/BadD/HgdB
MNKLKKIVVPLTVFIAVFVGHLLYYKIVSQNSSPIWWKLYVVTQTYLVSFSLGLSFAFGAYAFTMMRSRSKSAVAGSAVIAFLVWFTSACGAPMIAIVLGIVGVSIGTTALPPMASALMTILFISFGYLWLKKKNLSCADICAAKTKANAETFKDIGLDIEKFSSQQCVTGDLYSKTFQSQENRPKGMEYFDSMVSDIYGSRIKEILNAKKQGQVVIGNFCVFVPEELILSVGGISIGLCAGSQGPIPDAERVLPRNICPLVKSAYGYAFTKSNPYFQTVDFVCGETTCDAKKKTWELMNKEIPTYVMEIPQMKRQKDRNLWFQEVKDFKTKIEQMSKKSITPDSLTKAINIMNNKRSALLRLNNLRHHKPSPISGRDVLLVEQIAFYDDPIRFTEKVNILCDELEQRIKDGVYSAPPSAPRIMISGSPMALPNWKIHNLIESAGGIVVNEESCIGTRYFNDNINETNGNLDKQLLALTNRYMKINCACFTPNDERLNQIFEEYKASRANGLIHYSLQFCHTYNIEAIKIKEICDKEGIPFLAIETDYSTEDIGQLQTRIEAFLEQIRG